MPFPFRSILVPVDFDGSATIALDLAKGLAAAGDATLHLMHVMAIVLTPGEGTAVVVAREDEVKGALEKMAREELGAAPHQIHVRIGETASAVVEAARDLRVDLIVMPTHGRRGLPRFFLGSVAERLVREAPCPVLTVRPSTAAALEGQRTVGQVMRDHPPSIGPTDTLASAHAIMQREDLLSIPVVSGGVLTGIVTDRDIRSHLGDLEGTRVQAAMAQGPVTVAPTMPVEEAARLLMKLGVGAVPVVENGKLIGLLSTREVIETLLDRGSKD
ncbi:MAG TPA: universal stress protein [Candidatus Binataceae bacterium]|nr:universal stress protein [Candidatus Binataceae bacterium]